MMGWWTVLDVIKQVKASVRQARDGYCPDWLAAFLGAGALVFTVAAFVAAAVQ
ncbi:hypothetical protein [Phenylobacterium sp.]|jgi:hypothetical protein|uniref:hypothetical protein n=1 Tax=Phenylobacterium sp. TaxID=1871053 RepID=UPI0025D04EDF|nr:hypothetical protein [Phenylobacterium sp.]MCA3740556.1 hypothetical protein [Phenylobacterium sp.]